MKATRTERSPSDLSEVFHPLLERSPVPMVELGGANHIVRYVNPAFCRLAGQPKEAMIGNSFAATARQGRECVAVLDRVYRTGEQETHTETEHPGAHPLSWSYAVWPVLGADRQVAGVMMQVTETTRFHRQAGAINEALVISSVRQHELTDAAERLNEQLHAEIADRKAAHDALRVSEERYRTLFDLGPVAVYSCDASGAIREFNLRAKELWGREPALGDTEERFCGSHKLFRSDGSFMPHDQTPVVDILNGRITELRDAEVLIERPDGSRVTVIVNIRPQKNDRGEIIGAINCFYDITDRKQHEEHQKMLLDELAEAKSQLQQVNEHLEGRVADEIQRRRNTEDTLRQAQKMEAIGQLTGGIAHDFNNLLTIVAGNIEMLERHLPDNTLLQRYTDAALRGSSRAALLTNRLLAFSRRQPLAPEVVSANKLVAGMEDLLRRTLGEQISIEAVLAGELWPTFVDFNQLENALINLAVNARDVMPEGGKLTVETANCHLDEAYAAMNGDILPGQYVGVFVTDTGTGMPPEVIARVFEPFYTTKEAGQGTGLGLSQVYGFVQQSQGHVKIYSEVGEGTTVKIYLPRHRGIVPEHVEHVDTSAPRGQGETLLVVEDDPDVRNYTIEVLHDLGYRVLAADEGRSALSLLDGHPEVSLLFTDVVLPGGMTGEQLADTALLRYPRLKVLYTTGYARNAVVHQGRLDPGVEVIFKPFRYSEIAEKLRQVLDGGGEGET